MIKVATPKQHPYASHVSQFAVFPSFRSPDDPETGLRASRQRFPSALVPNSAPDITLISKTKGEEQDRVVGVRTWIDSSREVERWSVFTQAIRTDMRSYSRPLKTGERVSSGAGSMDSMMWVMSYSTSSVRLSKENSRKTLFTLSSSIQSR